MLMTRQRQLLILLLLTGIPISMAGCTSGDQGSSKRPLIYKVTGKATYLGAPLIGAVVTFAPQEKQPAAVGRTNDAGEFAMTTYRSGDGAAAGEFKVLVMLVVSEAESTPQQAHSTQPGSVSPGSAHSEEAAAKSSGSLLPAKYGDANETPLKAKVEPKGTNKFTFEIK